MPTLTAMLQDAGPTELSSVAAPSIRPSLHISVKCAISNTVAMLAQGTDWAVALAQAFSEILENAGKQTKERQAARQAGRQAQGFRSPGSGSGSRVVRFLGPGLGASGPEKMMSKV